MRIWKGLTLVAALIGGLAAFGTAPSKASPLAAAAADAVAKDSLVERTQFYSYGGPSYYRRPIVRRAYSRPVYYGRPAYYRRPVVVRRSYVRPVYYSRPAYYRRPVVVRRNYVRPVYYARPAYYRRPVVVRRSYARPVYYGRPVARSRTVCRTNVRFVRTPYGTVRRPVRVCTRRY